VLEHRPRASATEVPVNRSPIVPSPEATAPTYYATLRIAPDADETPSGVVKAHTIAGITLWRKRSDGPSLLLGDLVGEPDAELTKAGWIRAGEWTRAGDHHEVVIVTPVLDCPAWCSDHAFSGPDVTEDGQHVRTVTDRVEVVDEGADGIVVNIDHPSEPDTFYALTADHLRVLREDVDAALVALEHVQATS